MAMNIAPIFVATIAIIALNLVAGLSILQLEDVKVSNVNGVLQCDQIECPAESVRCQVTKQSFEENLSKLKRENICYDASGNIVLERSWGEDNEGKQKVNLNIDVNSDGQNIITNSQHSPYADISKGIVGITQTVGSFVREISSAVRSFNWFPFYF